MNLNLKETSLCAEWGRSVGAALLRARNLYQGLLCAKSLVCLLPIAQPVTKQSLKRELNSCTKSAVQMTRDEVLPPQKPPRLQLCSICAPKILFPWVSYVAVFNIVRHWLMNIEACIATGSAAVSAATPQQEGWNKHKHFSNLLYQDSRAIYNHFTAAVWTVQSCFHTHQFCVSILPTRAVCKSGDHDSQTHPSQTFID